MHNVGAVYFCAAKDFHGPLSFTIFGRGRAGKKKEELMPMKIVLGSRWTKKKHEGLF